MRALVLNGAVGTDPVLSRCKGSVVRALEARAVQVDVRRMHEIPVAWCQGCFDCWIHTPGICKIDDAGRSIAETFAKSDILICLTPVTFGGYSSELKKALDRTLSILLPFFKQIDGEVHHPQRYARHLAIGVVATLEHPDTEAETVLRTLVTRNAINFAAPLHAVAVLNGPRDEARESAACTALIDSLTASPPPTAHVHVDDVDRLLPAFPCAEDTAPPLNVRCCWWGAQSLAAPVLLKHWGTSCWHASRRAALQPPYAGFSTMPTRPMGSPHSLLLYARTTCSWLPLRCTLTRFHRL